MLQEFENIQNIPSYYKKIYSTKLNKYTIISADMRNHKIAVLNKDIQDNSQNTIPNYEDAYKYNLYRSVIMSNDETKLFAFSLPKSVNFNIYKDYYKVLNKNDFLINEIIEGTMINLWFDYEVNKWEISTKSAVGSNYYYYQPVLNNKQSASQEKFTFREMFIETFCDFTTDDFKNNSGFEQNKVYSFVLQHPNNHMVLNILEKRVYLIAVFEIKNNTFPFLIKYIFQPEFQNWNYLYKYNNLCFPNIFYLSENETTHKYKDLIDYINYNQNICGIMITNQLNGDRTKIENPIYNNIKSVRGNHSSLKYKYYELFFSKEKHAVSNFLRYFPKYKVVFKEFYDEFNEFIKTVHDYYVRKFIFKNITNEIPYNYLYHIYKLHYTIYVPSLKALLEDSNNENNTKDITNQSSNTEKKTRTNITLSVIYKYFIELKPSEMLYWLKPSKKHSSKFLQKQTQNKENINADMNIKTDTDTSTWQNENEFSPVQSSHSISLDDLSANSSANMFCDLLTEKCNIIDDVSTVDCTSELSS
jgi:hypothetical protein